MCCPWRACLSFRVVRVASRRYENNSHASLGIFKINALICFISVQLFAVQDVQKQGENGHFISKKKHIYIYVYVLLCSNCNKFDCFLASKRQSRIKYLILKIPPLHLNMYLLLGNPVQWYWMNPSENENEIPSGKGSSAVSAKNCFSKRRSFLRFDSKFFKVGRLFNVPFSLEPEEG